MSLIAERRGKSSGAYERILGNQKLDLLISRIQATTIAAGRELEKLVYQNSKLPMIKDESSLKEALNQSRQRGAFLLDKNLFKTIQSGGRNQPDFVIVDTKNKSINVVELKEGWVFDTKKSEGELKHLREFEVAINGYLKTLEENEDLTFKVKGYLCSFHAPSKDEMVAGCKKKIPREVFLTNDEFCEMVAVDFHRIESTRKKHQKQNFDFFINSLVEIPEVTSAIVEVKSAKLKRKNLGN